MFKKTSILILTCSLLLALLVVGCAPEEETHEADVVVVGGGGAGLSAAIEAAENDASVILLEKMPSLGGSTLISGGIIYGAETPTQERAGIEDSWEDLSDYWMEIAQGDADEEIIDFVAKKSGETIGWLEDVGVEFAEPTPQGTSDVPRGHAPPEGRGFALTEPLMEKAEELDVEILLETKGTELITNDADYITGVKAESEEEELTINAEAVILATGGYAQNDELMEEYAPVAEDHATYVSQGHTGQGLVMAEEVGAEIISKNGVIGFRGVAEDVDYTSALGGLIFTPSLYVDQAGERFIDETTHYSQFYDKMVENQSDEFYLIFDSTGPSDVLEEGIEQGYAFTADSIKDLGEEIGVPADNFVETVDRYNELAEIGEDRDFGKDDDLMTSITEEDFYALRVVPATLGTFGGPKVNIESEVLNEAGEPIPGLYAAGEVANGQFYRHTYPASGTSIQMSVTLGRVAGQNAADLIN